MLDVSLYWMDSEEIKAYEQAKNRTMYMSEETIRALRLPLKLLILQRKTMLACTYVCSHVDLSVHRYVDIYNKAKADSPRVGEKVTNERDENWMSPALCRLVSLLEH